MAPMPTPENVLLVCYGNLCRSPMAEGLLHQRLGSDWKVESAGTHAIGGDAPTPTAQEVMLRETGIDIGELRSSLLTVGRIEAAGYVFTMSMQQAFLTAALAPGSRDRIRLFGAFDPATETSDGSADPGGPRPLLLEVPDPIGGDYEDYLVCMRRLQRASERCAAWLLAGAATHDGPPPLGSARWPFPQRA